MARSNVTQRLKLAVATAAERHPQLAQRSISPHTVRHTTAMHLLQSGVDITVIALWLGHESPATGSVDAISSKPLTYAQFVELEIASATAIAGTSLGELHIINGWA